MNTILSLFKMISELWNLINGAIALWQASKREGWIQDGQKLTDAIKNAKTDEERKALVRRLADSLHATP